MTDFQNSQDFISDSRHFRILAVTCVICDKSIGMRQRQLEMDFTMRIRIPADTIRYNHKAYYDFLLSSTSSPKDGSHRYFHFSGSE